jgi:hypothetical protein
MSLPKHCYLLPLQLWLANSLHLPWNLVASRTPKYQDLTSWSQNAFSVSETWDFPDNRDPDLENKNSIQTKISNGLNKSEWLIPPSRNEQDSDSENGLENDSFIIYTFEHIVQEIGDLWNKMPSNIVDKVKNISKVIMVDPLKVISTFEYENKTKSQE